MFFSYLTSWIEEQAYWLNRQEVQFLETQSLFISLKLKAFPKAPYVKVSYLSHSHVRGTTLIHFTRILCDAWTKNNAELSKKKKNMEAFVVCFTNKSLRSGACILHWSLESILFAEPPFAVMEAENLLRYGSKPEHFLSCFFAEYFKLH